MNDFDKLMIVTRKQRNTFEIRGGTEASDDTCEKCESFGKLLWELFCKFIYNKVLAIMQQIK